MDHPLPEPLDVDDRPQGEHRGVGRDREPDDRERPGLGRVVRLHVAADRIGGHEELDEERGRAHATPFARSAACLWNSARIHALILLESEATPSTLRRKSKYRRSFPAPKAREGKVM